MLWTVEWTTSIGGLRRHVDDYGDDAIAAEHAAARLAHEGYEVDLCFGGQVWMHGGHQSGYQGLRAYTEGPKEFRFKRRGSCCQCENTARIVKAKGAYAGG